MRRFFYPEMPRLGEPAPEFIAATTHGEVKLSDYKDKKWVVLFSHPADFTPVCTTEFVTFLQAYPEFEKRNVALIGLSGDSVSSHLAWIRDIEEKLGVHVPFPVIADLDMGVVSLYGMIQPAMGLTAACRAVFFIDPKGILRAMIYYPLTAGRCVAEILRVLDALQVNDTHHVTTPANRKPGDKVIVPAPTTQKGMEEREKITGPDKKTWYLLMKDLQILPVPFSLLPPEGRSMVEMMIAETAYVLLGVPADSDFAATAKAFRDLRDKYNPETNPYRRKEFAEVMAAFEFLQRQF